LEPAPAQKLEPVEGVGAEAGTHRDLIKKRHEDNVCDVGGLWYKCQDNNWECANWIHEATLDPRIEHMG
jgi:hypothetical protein